MEPFDLKKFREDAGLTQQEFADKIEYSQATISRIERGEKNVTDKLLLKIESKFATNLDAYKKYEKNKKPASVNTNAGFREAEHNQNTNDHIHHFSGSELEQKYYQLLEEKSRMDERYFALSKDHELTTAELLLIKENNTLLRKIAANTDELLLKFSEMVKI
jgi:transcriptional regulator with XRE-family HTH domain